VQIFDYDTAEGHPYIVMEYLMGPSLATYLREMHSHNQRLQPVQIARLLITIATALDYAHERGVIHRDIKPGNIILHNKASNISTEEPITERTEAVLTDFGLVRSAQAVTQTASGAVSGTPVYMSPEQAQGLKVDHRSDIYSLGVVLYEMIAGRLPFEGDTSWTLIFKHINEPPPAIAGIQPVVQKVIDRALAKKPEDRYQTARALAADYMDAIGMLAEASTLRMSIPPSRLSRSATTSQKENQRSSPVWSNVIPFTLIPLLLVVLALFAIPRLTASNGPTETPNGTENPTETNVISPVDTRAPVGLLRFQDGTAPADAVTISTSTMPPPPTGSQYEAWLIADDGEGRRSLGIIKFDQNNKGSLNFVDSEGRNLLGIYSALEVTIEPDPDTNTNTSNNIAFSAKLPEGGLTHVRHLLYSFSATPNQIGFIRGLDAQSNQLTQSAAQMLTSLEAGNETDVQLQAESMLNLIVGSRSQDHKDWNGDGTITDPGDGYGLLQNADNLGYIQGTFTHANLAITSPDATDNMLIHGDHVKASADNVSNWTAALQAQLIDIIQNPSSPDREGKIRQAVATANQIRVGVDVNGNETIEPISGEGGVLTAYEHAYYMADMEILPTSTP
jgi:serine/threonine protein kinase